MGAAPLQASDILTPRHTTGPRGKFTLAKTVVWQDQGLPPSRGTRRHHRCPPHCLCPSSACSRSSVLPLSPRPCHWAPQPTFGACLPVYAVNWCLGYSAEGENHIISEAKRSECTETLAIMVSWGWRLKQVPSWERNEPCANKESGT